MKRSVAVIARLTVMLAAYVLALLVATATYIVTLTHAFSKTIVAETFLGAVAVGMIVTPVFAMVAAVAEWRRWRGFVLHLAIGSAIGFGAMALLQLRVGGPGYFGHAVTAGLVGAAIYWLIAGRRAGEGWR